MTTYVAEFNLKTKTFKQYTFGPDDEYRDGQRLPNWLIVGFSKESSIDAQMKLESNASSIIDKINDLLDELDWDNFDDEFEDDFAIKDFEERIDHMYPE